MREYFVYMLLCADGSFYVGVTNDPERRLWEHNAGIDEGSYTHERRPVKLVYCSAPCDAVLAAIAWEKQLKGWSRAKKRALLKSDWQGIHQIVRAERKRRESLSP